MVEAKINTVLLATQAEIGANNQVHQRLPANDSFSWTPIGRVKKASRRLA